MNTPIPFGTRLIGQTEKTLNAILNVLLTGSDITEPQWVALTVTLHAGTAEADEAALRIATTLKTTPDAGGGILAALIERGLVGAVDAGMVTVTDDGRAFRGAVQREVEAITARLWGDIPATELETAAAVLATVQQRAAGELAALGRRLEPVE